jgi:urease accessory protein
MSDPSGMRKAYELVEPEGAAEPSAKLELPYDERTKSRARVTLSDGSELALRLPRGTVLRDGARLLCDDGSVVAVEAAPESVSTARAETTLLLLRAAYHLGNRHVPLELGDGFVRYQHDHVLDDMVRELGLGIRAERAPFEPEAGAYAHHHAHHRAHHRAHHQGHHHDHQHEPHEHGGHEHEH